jgi:hypothetical protein
MKTITDRTKERGLSYLLSGLISTYRSNSIRSPGCRRIENQRAFSSMVSSGCELADVINLGEHERFP